MVGRPAPPGRRTHQAAANGAGCGKLEDRPAINSRTAPSDESGGRTGQLCWWRTGRQALTAAAQAESRPAPGGGSKFGTGVSNSREEAAMDYRYPVCSSVVGRRRRGWTKDREKCRSLRIQDTALACILLYIGVNTETRARRLAGQAGMERAAVTTGDDYQSKDKRYRPTEQRVSWTAQLQLGSISARLSISAAL